MTPPDIDADFTLQPSGNKANIYFSWVSNEPVIWQCEIMHDLMKINASCSEGSWKGFNLPEGKYILKVEATDEAINKAIMSNSFSVNLSESMLTADNASQNCSNQVTTAPSRTPIKTTISGVCC